MDSETDGGKEKYILECCQYQYPWGNEQRMDGQREKLSSVTVTKGSSHFRRRSETRISLCILCVCEAKGQFSCMFLSLVVGICALPNEGRTWQLVWWLCLT